jgi:ribosomal protein L7Ae-like RNA K-turn-binding protein
MNPELLGMLGLAKRGGMLVAGEAPVEALVRLKGARILLCASDAADNTLRRIRHFSETGACLWLRVPFTKAELGQAIGRSSCAMLALTNIGFSAAFVRRLAEQDPRAYGEAAEKLDMKARRAAERKSAVTHREKKPDREKGGPSAVKAAPPPEKTAEHRRSPYPGHSRTKPPGFYKRSRPVKKGKGSFRKKNDS